MMRPRRYGGFGNEAYFTEYKDEAIVKKMPFLDNRLRPCNGSNRSSSIERLSAMCQAPGKDCRG